MYTAATPVWRVEYINAKKTSFLHKQWRKEGKCVCLLLGYRPRAARGDEDYFSKPRLLKVALRAMRYLRY